MTDHYGIQPVYLETDHLLDISSGSATLYWKHFIIPIVVWCFFSSHTCSDLLTLVSWWSILHSLLTALVLPSTYYHHLGNKYLCNYSICSYHKQLVFCFSILFFHLHLLNNHIYIYILKTYVSWLCNDRHITVMFTWIMYKGILFSNFLFFLKFIFMPSGNLLDWLNRLRENNHKDG